MTKQRYQVQKKIDVGGMAEVWRGVASIQGFEKIVAIKRVLPHLAANEKFISMFMDEARLALYLNHANIVQTFDIGSSKDNYFIVMEWIDGLNLKSLMKVVREQQLTIPREQAVYIAAEICRGLSHAHQCKDTQGNPLDIVHRDVSPPNVLLSREGEVKIVDFGLARAKTHIRATDPGIVKGKFGYLCPEATTAGAVDLRADIFSTGIILWELLAGRRLFLGESNLDTVKLVREAQIPSICLFNPEVEAELDALVRKALSREARDRYQSCEEFSHELTRYLFSNQLMVSSYDIAVLVKQIQASATAPSVAPRAESSATPVDDVVSQLSDFVSLEKLEKMSFVSVSEDSEAEDDFSTPDGGVDPREWADEFEIQDEAPTLYQPDLVDRLKASLTVPSDEVNALENLGETMPPRTPAPPPPMPEPEEDVLEFMPVYSRRPTPPEPSVEDNAVLTGALLGLAGAILIIGITWFLFS